MLAVRANPHRIKGVHRRRRRVASRVRFPGQYYDQETGLFYNYFRDYEPGTGRYIEADPSGLNGGLNRYAYVGDSPLRWIDPRALAKCVYSVSQHTLSCSPNDPNFVGPPVGVGPDGMFSGVDECRNNNACTGDFNKGPIVPGNYKMNPDDRSGHENFWRLEPVPKIPGWQCGWWSRCGFELHIGSISLGCITTNRHDPTAVQQYNQTNDLLQSESGGNTLIVTP